MRPDLKLPLNIRGVYLMLAVRPKLAPIMGIFKPDALNDLETRIIELERIANEHKKKPGELNKYLEPTKQLRTSFDTLKRNNDEIIKTGFYRLEEGADKLKGTPEVRSKTPQVDKNGMIVLSELAASDTIFGLLGTMKQETMSLMNIKSHSTFKQGTANHLLLEGLLVRLEQFYKLYAQATANLQSMFNRDIYKKYKALTSVTKNAESPTPPATGTRPASPDSVSLKSVSPGSASSAESKSSESDVEIPTSPSSARSFQADEIAKEREKLNKQIAELQKKRDEDTANQKVAEENFNALLAQVIKIKQEKNQLSEQVKILESQRAELTTTCEALADEKARSKLLFERNQSLMIDLADKEQKNAESTLTVKKLADKLTQILSAENEKLNNKLSSQHAEPETLSISEEPIDTRRNTIETGTLTDATNQSEEKAIQTLPSEKKVNNVTTLIDIIRDGTYWKSKSIWSFSVPDGIADMQKILCLHMQEGYTFVHTFEDICTTGRRKSTSKGLLCGFFNNRDPLTDQFYKIFTQIKSIDDLETNANFQAVKANWEAFKMQRSFASSLAPLL